METRRVTFINQKTQSQRVIENSTATNLGELKQEMRANGIDYEGMTFYEGHMRAELKDDASPLPTNIPYKGTVVNDLTFMLTTPEKKVKSGAMSRAEAYAEIKRLGLQEECKKRFGRNFTQCTTNDLVSLVQSENRPVSAVVNPVNEEPVIEAEPVVNDAEVPSTPCGCGCANVRKAFEVLVEALYDNDVIEQDTFEEIHSILESKEYSAPKKMSKDEIDEMFNFVK